MQWYCHQLRFMRLWIRKVHFAAHDTRHKMGSKGYYLDTNILSRLSKFLGHLFCYTITTKGTLNIQRENLTFPIYSYCCRRWLSIDILLYITASEGHFEIYAPLTRHAMKYFPAKVKNAIPNEVLSLICAIYWPHS